MSDINKKYERYKQHLLESYSFKEDYQKKYDKVITVEKEYIERKGIFPYVFLLGAGAGFSSVAIHLEFVPIFVKILLALVLIVCCSLSGYLVYKFKEKSGSSTFYSYVRDEYIKTKIHNDNADRQDNYINELKKKNEYLIYLINDIEKNIKYTSQENKELVKKISSVAAGTRETLEEQEANSEIYKYLLRHLPGDYELSVYLEKRNNNQ